MPITDQQIRALAFLAAAARPHGARRWDEPGIAAAITRVRHLHLPDVALAVIRAADDRTLDTPGAIANPTASCWRERATDRPFTVGPRVEPQDRCSVCSQPLVGHHPTDGHDPIRRIPQPLTDHAATRLQYARQAIGDAKAQHDTDQGAPSSSSASSGPEDAQTSEQPDAIAPDAPTPAPEEPTDG